MRCEAIRNVPASGSRPFRVTYKLPAQSYETSSLGATGRGRHEVMGELFAVAIGRTRNADTVAGFLIKCGEQFAREPEIRFGDYPAGSVMLGHIRHEGVRDRCGSAYAGSIGDNYRFADRGGKFRVVPQARPVEDHARLWPNVDIVEQAQNVTLAPIRREGNADAVTGPLAIDLVKPYSRILPGIMDVGAGVARPKLSIAASSPSKQVLNMSSARCGIFPAATVRKSAA